jgi:hypothetical protein
MNNWYLLIIISLGFFNSMIVGYMLGLNRGYKISNEIEEMQADVNYNAGFVDGMSAANEL